jgi:hypothetical protein
MTSKKPSIKDWTQSLRQRPIRPHSTPKNNLPNSPVRKSLSAENLTDRSSISSIDSFKTLINLNHSSSSYAMNLSDLKVFALKSITKFDGDFSQLNQFLQCIESFLNDLDESDQMHIVPLLTSIRQTLVSPKIFEKIRDMKFNNFLTFKKSLCDKLYESEPPSVLRTDLDKIEQLPTQKTSDYIDKFRTSLNILKSAVDDDIFKSNLYNEEKKKFFLKTLLPTYAT